MITRDVRVEGFSAEDWARLASLLSPARAPHRWRRNAGILAFTEGERLRKLLSTAEGRLELGSVAWSSARSAESLARAARAHGARWAVRVEGDALSSLADRFALGCTREYDYLDQILLLLRVLRQLEDAGQLTVWPVPLRQWPIPARGAVFAATDVFCPPHRSVLLVALDRDGIHTSVLLHRASEGFDAIVGPECLRKASGIASGDWRRDQLYAADAARELYGDVVLGVYAHRRTFDRLRAESTPGVWAGAWAARELVLSPAPVGALLPLGLDAGRAVVESARGAAVWLGLPSLASGIRNRTGLGPAWDAAVSPTLEWLPMPSLGRLAEARLGFDPWVLLRFLLG